MFKAFGLFFIFIVIAVVILILGILGKIMNIGKRGRSNPNSQYGASNRNAANRESHQKEFSKNEGEYVDFEEIKNDGNNP